MSYIEQEIRDELETALKDIALILTGRPRAGNLTYVLYTLCTRFVAPFAGGFSDLNEVIGCLESTKQEFYRRQIAPYEDQKIEENGDVS